MSRFVPVVEATHVAQARRSAAEITARLGFDDVLSGRVAIVVTEAATNLLKHAGGGDLFVGTTVQGRGVQVVAMDRGRGITDLAESLRDGFSTTRTAGTGLGAIRRSATTFDVFSNEMGTVLTATILDDGQQAAPIGAVVAPAPGERECGDAWATWSAGALRSIFICDGLGHGSEAARAGLVAVEAFHRNAERSATEVVTAVHEALRGTRGAAVAVAELDQRTSTVRYCGLGNISATLVAPTGEETHLVSLAGVAGHVMRRVRAFNYTWSGGSLLVLHTDGIGTRWSIPKYAGLISRRPEVIAGVLYRDSKRGRDDATVVVMANREAA